MLFYHFIMEKIIKNEIRTIQSEYGNIQLAQNIENKKFSKLNGFQIVQKNDETFIIFQIFFPDGIYNSNENCSIKFSNF